MPDGDSMLKILIITFIMLFGCKAASAANEVTLAPGMVNPGYHETPSWFKESFLDLREDVKEATQAKHRVMLYFYQDGCPYCAKLLQDNFGQKSIADKTRQHFDVIPMNIWGDREVVDMAGQPSTEKSFAKLLRVQFTPTLLMLDEKGEVVLRLNGYTQPNKFTAALDFVGGQMEKRQPFADYLAANIKEPASGKLHSEPWLLKHPLKLAPAKKDGKPLLVLFEQKECAACDELHKEAFVRSDVVTLLRKFQVAQVDLASHEKLRAPAGDELSARDWARKLDIFYTPSLVYFDSNGHEVFRVEGYLRPFHLASSLDYVSSGAYRIQPEFQRFIEARATAMREKGEQVDIMN